MNVEYCRASKDNSPKEVTGALDMNEYNNNYNKEGIVARQRCCQKFVGTRGHRWWSRERDDVFPCSIA